MLFYNCSSADLEIKHLILAKEHRNMENIKNLTLLNRIDKSKSLFTVKYEFRLSDQRSYIDSIQVNRTMDGIFSECPWH